MEREIENYLANMRKIKALKNFINRPMGCTCGEHSNLGVPSLLKDEQKTDSIRTTCWSAEQNKNSYVKPTCPKPQTTIPRAPMTVEIRGGKVMETCHCLKRNGLERDCPKAQWGGRPECYTSPRLISRPKGVRSCIEVRTPRPSTSGH